MNDTLRWLDVQRHETGGRPFRTELGELVRIRVEDTYLPVGPTGP